jgi:thiosulfate/3-mercaptopyruvate sulfurtransferase
MTPDGTIEVSELAQLLHRGTPRVRVVDCRFSLTDLSAGQKAYAAGHLPGAVFADLEQDLSGPIVAGKTGRHPLPAPLAIAARFAAWGIDTNTLVVAYDDGSCMFAPRLWWLLRWFGHIPVAVLKGGLPAWVNEGQPLTQDVPNIAPTSFAAQTDGAMLATLGDVEAISSGAQPTGALVDARGEARYRGEQEPIDPVAGHIPTARNLPYTSLVSNGAPKPESEVRQLFHNSVGHLPATQIVAYCGSGVTACALIWAAESAHLNGIRLYPGSWSEWITDRRRPIAKGQI